MTSGGHVSAGEEPEEAVLRETEEETGYRLNPDKLLSLGYAKEPVGNDREIAYLYVYVETDPPFRPGEEVIYMVSADIDRILWHEMMKGERDSVVVIPAIKTGPMTEEAFSRNDGKLLYAPEFSGYRISVYKEDDGKRGGRAGRFCRKFRTLSEQIEMRQ